MKNSFDNYKVILLLSEILTPTFKYHILEKGVI